MIEIIKAGTKKELTCKYCGCVFTYEEEDIKHKEFGRMNETELVSGIRGGFKNLVICPQCGKEIVLQQTRGL